jgi:hypothetical protein
MTDVHNANPITYADWANTRDPDGKTADILEILRQNNPIIDDAFVREGNLTEGHQTTIRTGLPRGTWIGYNEGSAPQKANSRPTIDRAARMQAYSEVDMALVKLEADQAAFRLSESSAFLQGMSIDHAETLFYGNSFTEPKKFMGLTPRYNDVAAESGMNIINGQVAAGFQQTPLVQTSIWFVTWGDKQTGEFFPKGTMVGLEHEDLGQVTTYDALGGRFEIYRDRYEQRVGCTVRDWRANVRIAQIPTAAMLTDSVNLPRLLTEAWHKLDGTAGGRTFIYCSDSSYLALDHLASSKSNGFLTMKEWAGAEIAHFRGIPIRVCDAILDTEPNVLGLTTNHGGNVAW